MIECGRFVKLVAALFEGEKEMSRQKRKRLSGKGVKVHLYDVKKKR